jgi:hypothetical protein
MLKRNNKLFRSLYFKSILYALIEGSAGGIAFSRKPNGSTSVKLKPRALKDVQYLSQFFKSVSLSELWITPVNSEPSNESSGNSLFFIFFRLYKALYIFDCFEYPVLADIKVEMDLKGSFSLESFNTYFQYFSNILQENSNGNV